MAVAHEMVHLPLIELGTSLIQFAVRAVRAAVVDEVRAVAGKLDAT